MKLRKVLNDPPKDYFTKLAHVESNNNPLAKAKTSSAAGLYQFTKGTWEGLTKQLGLDYSLEDRFDPKKSREVVEAFTSQNKRYLKNKLGRDPNEAELYLAHFSGMGGASKMLSSLQDNPNVSVRDVFKENQIKANKSVFLKKDGSTKTVEDIYNWAANKFNVDEFNVENNKEKLESIKNESTSINKFREDLPTVVIESTKVKQPTIKNDLIDVTYTKVPESNTQEEPQISEEKIRKILQNEKQNAEKNFLKALSSTNQTKKDYTPQAPREDLSYLYNYISLSD